MSKNYNSILIEFEVVIDLDLALFKFIKEKYNNPTYINQDIISMNDESEIVKMMINRQSINPLELFMNADCSELYNDIMDNHMEELLQYAKASDLFGLMVTFLREATSVDITVFCHSKLQEDFIKSLNSNLNTVVFDNYKKVPVNNYTILYIKYYSYILKYNSMAGKHIYIINARYNMEPEKNIPIIAISALVGDINIIHTVDMYRKIKLERKIENE